MCFTIINSVNKLLSLTEEENFAQAAYKVIQEIGTSADIEEIKWMKNFKPAINKKYDDANKLYMPLMIHEEYYVGKYDPAFVRTKK